MSVEERPERKARKSVAFTEQQIVVDQDGTVTTAPATMDDGHATSAQSHTPPQDAANGDTGLDLALKKKKKKKALKEDEDGEDGGDAAGGEEAAAAPAEDTGIDLSLKKKKKKKVAKDEDDFVAKLKALEVDGGEEADGADGEAEPAAAAAAEPKASSKAAAAADEMGDMDKGTGVWAHSQTESIPYAPQLDRFFKILAEKNPDHASSGSRTYKIPPPQCLREGNKKTIFANIADICKRMKRTEEHVTAYLFAELGTSGSVDGNRRLVIKGRFQQKQIENVLRKYIVEYVTCKTCRSHDTGLSKGENRLYFITCNSCGSRRTVTAIKTGFSAQVGKRKKMQG